MSDEQRARAQAEEDFRLYLTLSEEMLKFISREDVEEFLDLQQQRDALVERMKKNPATEAFREEAACRAIVARIQPIEQQLLYKAKAWLNKSRRQTAAVKNYSVTPLDMHPAGNFISRDS